MMIEATRALNLQRNFPWAYEIGATAAITKEDLPPYQGKSQHPVSPRIDEKDAEIVPGITEHDQLANILKDLTSNLDP